MIKYIGIITKIAEMTTKVIFYNDMKEWDL
jgi:hypothetical protein